MTPKELYELAKTLGAEDFKLRIYVFDDATSTWPNVKGYKVLGIDDVSFSEKEVGLKIDDV